MDRVFLDANVLFSAAWTARNNLLRLWRLSDVVLCSSRYAVAEATVNLADDEQRRRLTTLAEPLFLAEASSEKLPTGVSLPEKDVPILLAAIEAKATHLLTGDLRDFGKYFGKRIAGILVLPPADYLKRT